MVTRSPDSLGTPGRVDPDTLVELLVRGSPYGILAFDREFRYTIWNPGMERIAGVPADRVIGRVAWEVFPFLKEEGEDVYFAAALAGETRRTPHRPFRVPESGRQGFFQAEYAPVHATDGSVAGGMAMLRETTAERAAEEALRMRGLVLESMSEGVSVCDEAGYIVYTNPAEDRMFGYAPGELIGQHVTIQNAYPPEENQRIVEEVIRRLRDDGVWMGEWENVRKDGSPFVTRARITALELGGRQLWVCVQEDVTARKHIEAEWKRARAEAERSAEAERRARERIQLLADAGTVLASSLDVRSTLDHLARLIVPTLADWCFVELPTPDGRIEPATIYHQDPARIEWAHQVLQRYPIDPEAPHGTGKVLRTGEPEVVPDIPPELYRMVAQDAEHLELLIRVGFRSYVCVPLPSRDRVLGVLTLVSSDPDRRYGPDDLPFVEELARKAALAIDNARLFEAQQQARREAEREAERARLLRDVAEALNEAATPQDVAEVCVTNGMAALGAHAGSLAILNEEGDTFQIVRSDGYRADITERWRHFPLSPGRPLSDAVLTRTPVLIGSVQEWWERYPNVAPDAIADGLASFATIPLYLGDRPLGGLSFSFRDDQPFDAGDRTFLSTLGEQAVQALDRARLLETERLARQEAEEANRAKTQFLSAMSHELRTPLNAIAGYVELLEMGIHGPVTAEQRAAMRRISRAQEVLLSLINDVLNFARVEAGRLEIATRRVELAESVESLEPLIAPQLQARGLEYRCDPGPVGLAATGDPERIRQILLNLLGNAVKFTSPGGRVSLSVRPVGDQVEVRISDTGRGIQGEHLERIFDPFVQIDRHRTDESQQGIGLGLAISRELARAMGGDLLAESAPGEGSTFTLRLRAAES